MQLSHFTFTDVFFCWSKIIDIHVKFLLKRWHNRNLFSALLPIFSILTALILLSFIIFSITLGLFVSVEWVAFCWDNHIPLFRLMGLSDHWSYSYGLTNVVWVMEWITETCEILEWWYNSTVNVVRIIHAFNKSTLMIEAGLHRQAKKIKK